jgi:hypothetical protein
MLRRVVGMGAGVGLIPARHLTRWFETRVFDNGRSVAGRLATSRIGDATFDALIHPRFDAPGGTVASRVVGPSLGVLLLPRRCSPGGVVIVVGPWT